MALGISHKTRLNGISLRLSRRLHLRFVACRAWGGLRRGRWLL